MAITNAIQRSGFVNLNKIVRQATDGGNVKRTWPWSGIAALPMLAYAVGAAQAQEALSYSNSKNVVVCAHATSTATMKDAIDNKADPGFIDHLAAVAHCTTLPPDVGFRTVKSVQVVLPTGTVDEVVGEVTLQDGSRSQFYVMKQDIATTPPTTPPTTPSTTVPANLPAILPATSP